MWPRARRGPIEAVLLLSGSVKSDGIGAFFWERDVVKKKTKRKRAKGAGRPHEYGEPAKSITLRLPERIVALLDELGGEGGRNKIAVQILRDSTQYRLRYGADG